MSDYIRRSDVKDVLTRRYAESSDWSQKLLHWINQDIKAIPAAEVVPWEFLERYADYFCAVVSMPEFIREAKDFYRSTLAAMEGGRIGGADNA